MTVGELSSRMSARELDQWSAYEKVHGPLGGMRDDILAALISATVVNSTPGRRRAVSVGELVPEWDVAPTTWKDDLAVMRQVTAAAGGTIEEG